MTTSGVITLNVQSNALPSWVPAAGEVAVLTQTNGKLSNRFNSCAAPYYGGATGSVGRYYLPKIANDYSGATLNKHYGPYGAMLFFGGGHAATNDNSLLAMVFYQDSCTFKRMVDPSPYFGTGTDDATAYSNTLTNINISTSYVNLDWCDAVVDQKPCSPHSEGAGDVIGPASGGAAYGTFINVILAGCNAEGQIKAEAAHKVEFTNLTGAADGGSPTYAWQRLALRATQSAGALPTYSAYVAVQNRVYYTANATTQIKWFDVATSAYVTGAGTALMMDSDGPYGGRLFYVEERGLLIFADQKAGTLRVRYCDVTASQPSWNNAAVTLSTPLAVALGWSAACWCSDNDRIIIGNVTGDNAAAFEIEIPATLSSTWTVTRAPFGAGQSIVWEPNNCFGKWDYNPATKSIVYLPKASNVAGTDDTVYVYRPRGV